MPETPAPDAKVQPSFQPGAVLDEKYRIAEEVGAGGMGRVVAAEHLLLKRRVAIKLLPQSGSSRRLLREARAAQSLRSENVIFVYDVGLEQDVPFIVMELLEGRNLSQLVAEIGPLPVEEAVDYVLQAAAGLAEAHAAGIVHRDIKPSNLFLTRRASGEPLIKVLDFGISKTSFADELPGELTSMTSVLGSPYYMSPEQLRDPEKVDARTDVWSLAVTLYALITGTRPFEGRSLTEVSAAIAADPYPTLHGRMLDVPADLDELFARALTKRPELRTASVIALARELVPFASARGKQWAERLLSDYSQDFRRVPNTASATSSPAPTEAHDLTATDARLSGSNDVEAPAIRSASIEIPRKPRFGFLPVVGLLLAALAVVYGTTRLRSQRPADSGPVLTKVDAAAAPRAPAPPPPAAILPGGPAAAPAASPSATKVPEPTNNVTRPMPNTTRKASSVRVRELPPTQASAATPPQIAQVPQSPASAGVASANPKPMRPTPPVDIDGIPIVE